MKIKAYYIDPDSNTAEPREIETELDTYYRLLHCTCIDIVTRKIGGKTYVIICDDEGLFNTDPHISAIDDLGQPMLVGALLVTGLADRRGELTTLTDDDVRYISKRVVHLSTRLHPEGWQMLTQCEF